MDSDITVCVSGGGNWIFGRAPDEFRAEEREMDSEAGNITTSCGDIPCDMATSTRGDGEFLSKRVDGLVKVAQDSGFGNPVGSEGPVIGAEESVAGVPVGPVAEVGREVSPKSS